jgi:hypothetical protein
MSQLLPYMTVHEWSVVYSVCSAEDRHQCMNGVLSIVYVLLKTGTCNAVAALSIKQ